MVEVVPAILSTHRADYHKKFKAVEPLVDWVQIDVVDGRFAPNKTIGPEVVKAFRTVKKLEIQLMVNFIEDWVDRFVKIQSVQRIVFPIETAYQPIRLIKHIKRHKVEVGASVNPQTPVERLEHIIGHLDTALVLSVHPGFSGQHFVQGSFEKIKKIKQMRPNVRVEIDGAVSPGIARKAAEVGADVLIAGSFIFSNPKMEGETYHEKVKKAIDSLREDVEGMLPPLES
jgi:ribulose-phosphate 3-epimerase